ILRRGPGTTFEQVSMVLPGNPLPIVAKNVAGDWYQLENGAWVAAFLADRKLEELPVSDNIPSPPAGALDLEVSFTNPHYKCMQSAYSFENIAGEVLRPWVYRSFQVGMSIRNLNTAPVLPIYKPSRWIVTDGVYEFVETVSWQATGSGPAEDRQRILYYDDAASMTWYMVSLERDQWVRAIEFEWNGQLYRTEFDPAQAQEVQNYKDCGESRASVD
ncbi:MAG: SH3 domain-containing protein, partial [Caldilinea sp.]